MVPGFGVWNPQIVIPVNPPSTGIIVPVTKEDALSDASQRSAPANSSGSPYLAIGVCTKIDFRRSSVKIFRFCSAGKNPGIMAFTRILCGAHSRARNFVILFTPAFDIEYVNTFERGISDDTDEMLIML